MAVANAALLLLALLAARGGRGLFERLLLLGLLLLEGDFLLGQLGLRGMRRGKGKSGLEMGVGRG